jgi:hypothetical protein
VKRTGAILFLLAAAANVGAPQRSVRIHGGFLKAEAYLHFDNNSKRAYAMGLLDGMYMAPMFHAPDDGKFLVSLERCVEGMRSSQVAAIIEKYIRDHPEHWYLDLKDEGYAAMRQACPVR